MSAANPSPSLETEPSPHVFVQNNFGDRYLYTVNRAAFEKLGASAAFEACFGKDLFQEDKLYVIIGTDSGLLIRFIIRKGIPAGSRYLFIELPAVLDTLKRAEIIGDLPPECACVTFDVWLRQAREFKINEYYYIANVALYRSLGAQDAYLPEYTELAWQIDEQVTQLRWEVINHLGQESFITCQLANLAENLLPASLLKDKFRGRTAVLLAGGPSLDERLSWVEAHRTKLAVLAVSRVSRRLQQVGIVPDLVFSVDPTELSFDVSKEILEFSEEVTLIHANHVTPLLLGQWRGAKFYLGTLLPWKSSLNPKSLPHPGPTVTNTALAVAHALGFTKIVLGGVDLCFSPEGYTHAKGSNEQLAGPRFDLTSLQVETNDGQLANTTHDFACAIHTLAHQLKTITAQGTEIINPSGRSAKIEGIVYRPIDEIALPRSDLDVQDVIAQTVRPITPGLRREHLRKTLNEVNNAIYRIEGIKQLASEALECNAKMYGEDGLIRDVAQKSRSDKIEKELNRKYKHFSRLTKIFGIRDFLKITRPFEREEMDAETAKALGNTYYEVYCDGADRLLKQLKRARERLEARQEEEKADPDLTVLFDRWQTDRQYRRARMWLAAHPSAAERLSPIQRSEFERFEHLYLETLQNTETRHLRRAKSHSDLAAARKRARILFSKRETQELGNLLAALAEHPNTIEAEPYRQLATGYLAQLNEDYETALNAYHEIIQGMESPLLEDALLQIALISLEIDHLDNAKSAFECLAQLSPTYLPQYAELLRISGYPMEAIGAYSDYLLKFQDDVYVQIKLAKLYCDLGSREAAKLMLDHIIAKNPTSESAATLAAIIDRS
jgi:hypothetical protein